MRRHRTAHSLLSALLQIILLWTNVNPRSHNGLLLMLVSCVKAQQQPQFIHTTATLSQSRVELAATSLGELVFFAGGPHPSHRQMIESIFTMRQTEIGQQLLFLFLALVLEPYL
jgi:hypothetical protein